MGRTVREMTRSGPALLDHRRLPDFAGCQHLILRPEDLRLHDLQLRADQQPNLPPELVGEQDGSRFAAVLVKAEQSAQLNRSDRANQGVGEPAGAWGRDGSTLFEWEICRARMVSSNRGGLTAPLDPAVRA